VDASYFGRIINTLQPVIGECIEESRRIDNLIKKEGETTDYLCDNCPKKNIINIEKKYFSDQEIIKLLEWLQSNDIRGLRSDGSDIRFRSSKKSIEGIGPTSTVIFSTNSSTEEEYEYKVPVQKLKEKKFSSILKLTFNSIYVCEHLNMENINTSEFMIFTKKPRTLGYGLPFSNVAVIEKLWTKQERKEEDLRLLCSECAARFQTVRCEESIRKVGFIYEHWCPIKYGVLKHRLQKYKIRFIVNENVRYISTDPDIYLPDLHTLITFRHQPRDISEVISTVQAECVVVFGAKRSLISYLTLGANLIIVDEESGQVLLYDKNRKIEESMDVIIMATINKIEGYSNELRGKEHDRLVGVLQRIGEELGFATQTEFEKKGSRVDLVWLNHNGDVYVAIEVETSAQWKKDLITTWEVEPKLAVIVTNYKTEKTIDDILQYNLLRYMPHKLLLINYLLKKAYLIELQQLMKYYDMTKKQS
jgi:hypothetical protein